MRGFCCKAKSCLKCHGTGDPDFWLTLPQPTEEMCRLLHGIGCTRGCTKDK